MKKLPKTDGAEYLQAYADYRRHIPVIQAMIQRLGEYAEKAVLSSDSTLSNGILLETQQLQKEECYNQIAAASKRLNEYERFVVLIEGAIDVLDHEQYDIVQCLYVKKYTLEQTAASTHQSRSALLKQRNKIFSEIERFMRPLLSDAETSLPKLSGQGD
jgi:6-phosphofructokinase